MTYLVGACGAGVLSPPVGSITVKGRFDTILNDAENGKVDIEGITQGNVVPAVIRDLDNVYYYTAVIENVQTQTYSIQVAKHFCKCFNTE